MLAALVATGVLIFQRTRTESHEVTSLVGLPRAEALNRISEFDWKTDIQHQRSDAQPFDVVYDQNPKDGKLKEGAAFTLYVSDGPVLHALPDISQQPQATAQATLAGLGLGLNVAGQQYDENLPAGLDPGLVGGRYAQPGRPGGPDGHGHRRRRLAGPGAPHHPRPGEPLLRRGQRRPDRRPAPGAAARAAVQRHHRRRQRDSP